MLIVMRAAASWFLVLIMASVVLSGCIGGDEEVESEEPEVEHREPLQTRITLDQPSDTWFAPGESLGVRAETPENAEGNVSYTWAIQPDPFTVWTPNQKAIDSGNLSNGETWDHTFDRTGFYAYGHCDPHPWMEHSVAVLDEYDGPDEVTVYMIEGELADQDTWKFVPEHLTVGVGTKVTYQNLGDVPHVASIAHEEEGVPVPELLGLEEQEGTVTLSGDDWMNIVVFVEDESGNMGWATQQVYVRERFEAYNETSSGGFTTTLEEVDGEDAHEHKFDWNGAVTLNVTLPNDPTGEVQRVDVELYEMDGDDRVATIIAENATGPGEVTGTFTTKVQTKYSLVVRPAQGLLIDYEIEVRVEYDHTPPELEQLPCPEPHYSLGHC